MTFQLACAEDALEPEEVEALDLDGLRLALVRDEDGSWHCLDDLCTHENVPLSDGDVEDGELECWKHGSAFNLRTGKPSCLPATKPVKVYPVKVEDGSVWVDVDRPINA